MVKMSKVAEWLGGNWGWVVLLLSLFVEITPIKVHPISAVLGWIGKKLNGPLKAEIDGIKTELATMKKETADSFKRVEERQNAREKDADLQRMAGIKNVVLDFANSCLHGRDHTLEEFDSIIDENKVYEKLYEKLKAKYGEDEIRNDKYKESFAYIMRLYRYNLDHKSFLQITGEGGEPYAPKEENRPKATVQ